MATKPLYVVVHEHGHGSDAYLFRAVPVPKQDKVVAALKIDFEPDKNESITISPVVEKDIVEL